MSQCMTKSGSIEQRLIETLALNDERALGPFALELP
jgi:hypothetical protein